MGMVEILVGNFPEGSKFSGNFEQLVDRATFDCLCLFTICILLLSHLVDNHI